MRKLNFFYLFFLIFLIIRGNRKLRETKRRRIKKGKTENKKFQLGIA